MKTNKNQHIIPQVYLKQFGFIKKFKTEKWFISVKNLEKNVWEDREIKNFLSEIHRYTLENYKEIHDLIIEKDLNGGIELRIPIVIDQLQAGKLTPNIQLALAETTANFLARTNRYREWQKGMLKQANFRNLFNNIIEFENYTEELKNNIFSSYSTMSENDAINSLMVFYMNHTSKQLQFASIEVLISTKKKPFFTTDNPVTLINGIGYGQIGEQEMEIYFPLSDTILIHFYWHKKGNPIQRTIRSINEAEYKYFHTTIIPMAIDKFIISPIDKSLMKR